MTIKYKICDLRSAPDETEKEGSLYMAVFFHDLPKPANKSTMRFDSFIGSHGFEKSQRDFG